jgi:TolB-like protein/Tfp pilus assembly protein PilF
LSLINELKRRNVFRVGVAYVVVAWLILQVSDVILNNTEAPGWVFDVILLLLGIGLPLVLLFAWAFELTPEGLKREKGVDRSRSVTPQTGKKLDRVILVVLLLALGYFAYDKFVLSAGRESARVEAAVEQAGVQDEEVHQDDKSIAVLPFVNMSSDPEQEYFSDGLSEELLNLLAKIPELKVASRSSAFQFKGEKIDLVDVAQKLKVAYVLEGSVRKSGNQLRITAQLIKAGDGFHLWSETYDRSLDNIFAIQDEISAAVVDALKIELLGEKPKADVVDPEAYALLLKARYLYDKWGKDNFAAAVEAYKQALDIDPGYADAWAGLSVTYLTQTQSGYLTGEEGLLLARAAVDKALNLNPDLATAWARLSLIQSIFEWDWTEADKSVQKALALAPNDRRVLGAAGNLANMLGRPDEASSHFQRVLEDDPLDLVTLYNSADMLHRQGQLEQSEAGYRRLLELNPEDWGSHTQLAIIMLQQGRAQEAWDELELEVDPQQQEYGRILALSALGKNDEAAQRLQTFIENNQSWAAFLIATVYAWQGDADTAFQWLDSAYEKRDGWMSGLLKEPLFTTLHDDPRWVALVDRMGLPHNY